MKVTIDNQNELLLEADIKPINEWWIASTSKIYKEDRLIYSVEIDDNPVFSGYEQIIVNDYRGINRINIITKTKKESIVETELALADYLDRFIPTSRQIADYFYGELSEEQWAEFTQLVEGLSWIVNSLRFLQILHENQEILALQVLQMEALVKELGESLERAEYTLTADLLNYEIIPLLEKMKINTIH
ncbi:hypothetical protein KIH86_27690 [Paenibacillus sp. HN-1]|uniref:hypothetical protein n=1 Tax=Paenibacillus TaxID=44249 RepID=UPI001CAA16B6|nr:MULTISPECIES: hypothetical protein [Paenibacillus]MBY9077601.1 hypothetical protein [Paenibacillus sp. CGMCC 1.18879]MBY9087977.1 hypothetical protein [Paenibacillus sinensis]